MFQETRQELDERHWKRKRPPVKDMNSPAVAPSFIWRRVGPVCWSKVRMQSTRRGGEEVTLTRSESNAEPMNDIKGGREKSVDLCQLSDVLRTDWRACGNLCRPLGGDLSGRAKDCNLRFNDSVRLAESQCQASKEYDGAGRVKIRKKYATSLDDCHHSTRDIPTIAACRTRLRMQMNGAGDTCCTLTAAAKANSSYWQRHLKTPATKPNYLQATCGMVNLIMFLSITLALVSVVALAQSVGSPMQADPRPTIYSGQVSIGLLLSAHSSLGGADMSSAASEFLPQTTTVVAADDGSPTRPTTGEPLSSSLATTIVTTNGAILRVEPFKTMGSSQQVGSTPVNQSLGLLSQHETVRETVVVAAASEQVGDNFAIGPSGKSRMEQHPSSSTIGLPPHGHRRRQIFEHQQARRQQGNKAVSQQQQKALSNQDSSSQLLLSHHQQQQVCNQVNPGALYAGMGAIWASHQANLVGDSQLAIGTYVYDSCNDLEVGQRQSVRIVSNLNAFQQTTCESPRGSPISLTIAHGDNQLRAIQLLTSFRVPVITTKEHFALEDYHLLSRDQRKFLFSTAPSSRHLALGALRFTRRIVARQASSPKLPNQFHRMSSKNGLIVLSRNLPARFLAYLSETIPNHVNYELLHSSQPIDQIRSVEALESILIKPSASVASQHSSSQSASESKLSMTQVAPSECVRVDDGGGGGGGVTAANCQKFETFENLKSARHKRNSDSSMDSDSASSSSDPDGNSLADNEQNSSGTTDSQQRMLSPAILMFITPSEAIDLITRLRNDLAEVSKYYSLIVTTREDISPALRTIFHRGGSRLCSGKAFYTISPKQDDISEFSRYFRDTVQMEGESSDHPLICEFAKYQASLGGKSSVMSSVNDWDDSATTEPVIKAVWSGAAAFKSVYRRECGALAGLSSTGSQLNSNLYSAEGGGGGSHKADNGPSSTRSSPHHQKRGRQSSGGGGGPAGSKSAHSECMVKMNKNMSNLVQRALKRLDVTVNSTGLQALDGFRIKFDEMNELMTNKFSIKYINKECEITEIGQYSGFKESMLQLDEDSLIKSLESILPDPWPITSRRDPPSGTSTTLANINTSSSDSSSSPTASTGSSTAATQDSSSSSTPANSEDSSSPSSSDSSGPSSTSGNSSSSSSSGDSSDETTRATGTADEEPTASSGSDNDQSTALSSFNDVPKMRRSNAALLAAAKRKSQEESRLHRQQVVAPITAMSGGRGLMPGLTDLAGGLQAASGETESRQVGGARQSTTASLPNAITAKAAMRTLKPFPTNSPGTTLTDWLPREAAPDTGEGPLKTPVSSRNHRQRQVAADEMTTRGSTESPVVTTTSRAPATLPESDGNTDLEMPTTKTLKGNSRQNQQAASHRSLDTAASATGPSGAGDFVTSSSVIDQTINSVTLDGATSEQPSAAWPQKLSIDGGGGSTTLVPPMGNRRQNSSAAAENLERQQSRLSSYLRDLDSAPIPLTNGGGGGSNNQAKVLLGTEGLRLTATASEEHRHQTLGGDPKINSRSRLRSHIKWIYSSWFALSILGANICGALLTLYVLTFLLMKNCDGSLDRENQGIRSMHLLAIIVVFFGSTLFIVYPTPGLCLLRSSWHNFALVLMFGTLLLQTMQIRSMQSLGLGGRPNRLNQFLTLIFMIGVQVSFELQRWKYESANYMNFVNQYLSLSDDSGGDRKLLLLSSASQFNPLNSFNDQVTPVSLQVSEKYQNLLHDYCSQQADEFLQSQFYLWLIICLLVVFSLSTRKLSDSRTFAAGHHQKFTSHHHALTSGKVLASQHEANGPIATSQFELSPSAANNSNSGSAASGALRTGGNVLLVTLVCTPIYFVSVLFHLYGSNVANHDLIFSVTMVLLAFVQLIGIFMPILKQVHHYESFLSTPEAPLAGGGSLTEGNTRHLISATSGAVNFEHRHRDKQHHSQTKHFASDGSPLHTSSAALAMFPEFTHTGFRRPSSVSGESGSGGGRRPFANTKESRRNMSVALANLDPSPDSLRSMGLYGRGGGGAAGGALNGASNQISRKNQEAAANYASNPAMLNLRLNLHTEDDQPLGGPAGAGSSEDHDHNHNLKHYHNHHHHHSHQQQEQNLSRRSSSNVEKRLIMLDVDPCCPRHGVAAWQQRASATNGSSCLDEIRSSKSCNSGSKQTRMSHQ